MKLFTDLSSGRPVLYKQYGKFDVSRLKTMTSMEAVMKYHIWEQEACLKLCAEQSFERGNFCRQFRQLYRVEF